jgi:uncharacterized protein YerC
LTKNPTFVILSLLTLRKVLKMNLPRFVLEFFDDIFTGAQVKVIDQNWYRYSQISLSNSSREALITEARSILRLVG